MNEIDELRREILLSALSAGVFGVAGLGFGSTAWAMGKVPHKLEPGRSIYDLYGDVRVNAKVATENTFIGANSTIATGKDSRIIFVVGQDAFVMRSNSNIKIEGSAILSRIRILSGKLLSVFGRRNNQQDLSIKTMTATIGIRGTGAYVEAEQDKTYICTCYGEAQLASIQDQQSRETVKTQHHDAPRFIYTNKPRGKNIQVAPVFNHTDDELALIETLVGRSVPFATGGYSAPRKSNY